MYIKIGWDEDFNTLMMNLWSKYGREMFTLDGIGDQLDLNHFSKTFFNSNIETTSDISVDQNANVVGKSVIDYTFEFAKPLQRYNSYFLLWKELKRLYGMEIANGLIEQQLNGAIYINDFSDIARPYCFNFSTNDIRLNGLEMSSRMTIKPPKSLQSFIRQVEQFTVYAANSTLGATGLADFLICCASYFSKIYDTVYIEDGCEVFKDGNVSITEPHQYLREQLTSFIYTINWEFRGNQSPFTNISVYDKYFIESLCEDYGVEPYWVQTVQTAFLECMEEELARTALTFPVITACMMVDKEGTIKDAVFKRFIAESNLKYGYINMYYGDTATLSSCCRLRSDTSNEYFNSFGAGSTKIGSLGVVTVNLPRLAKTSYNFLQDLEDTVVDVARINHAKRHIIKKRIELGALPLYTLGHMTLDKQYSTYGVTGLNEALEILGMDIMSEEGRQFVLTILDVINSTNDLMQKRYKAPHNCEQVPAESSSVKLASKDKMLNILSCYDFYSNQFIPLTKTANILDRLKLQGEFDKHFSGGAICHINIGEQIKDVDKLMELMDYAAKTGTVYWAVNYALHRCANSHCWTNDVKCPICGGDIVDTVTRVVGFFTSVKNWNKVRREHDWPNRQFYKKV